MRIGRISIHPYWESVARRNHSRHVLIPRLGILQAYGAESHRWKVTLHDGQDGFLVWQLECQCQKSTVCVQAVISDCFPIPSPPFGQTKTHQPPFLSEVFWIKPKLLKPLQLRRHSAKRGRGKGKS